MAKKTTTTKTAVTAKRSVKPVAKTKSNVAAALPAPAAKSKAPAKATPAKKLIGKRAAAPKAKAPAYSQDDVALRAYFIGEKRQQLGLPGDSHSDWIEAERQLSANRKK